MLHAVTYGQGTRHFVGYHGWGSEQSASFKALIPYIPEDARLTGVDLPGCGGSGDPESWSWERICDEAASHLEGLPLGGPVILVGSCSGSFNALEVALRLPERVSGVVMLEPFAFMPWFFGIFLTPLTGRLLYRGVFDNPVGKVLTAKSMARQGLHDDVDMVAAFGVGTSSANAYKYLQLYGELKDPAKYAPVSAPVLIVHGGKTFKAIRTSVAMWRENWPDLQVECVDGVGHMLTQEAPERVAKAIFAFHPTRC